jgi:glucose-1-phosphate thymidylyltransferase
MRAIVLAGGYAKRMGRLATELPKSLLPVAGRPAIEHILDKVSEIAPTKIFLTTNLKFEPAFQSWLGTKRSPNIELVVEHSKSESEKLGAVGALSQLAPKLKPDDYLIVCGDNIFKSSLKGMLEHYREKRRTVVAVYLQRSLDDVKLGSAVTIGEDQRIVNFEEKPKHPKTRLVGACIYILSYESLLKTRQYLDEGGNTDEPGNFIAWLCKQEQVYAHMLHMLRCFSTPSRRLFKRLLEGEFPSPQSRSLYAC